MTCDTSQISNCDQMKCVADSMKPIGSRFENEISYEINGCILTWIANHSGLEHRFDCSNIIEIIDGYYKAEFYLDTKRIFEVPEFIESYTDITDIHLTGYNQDQDDTQHTSNDKSRQSESSTKIDTISNASTDADISNDTNTNNDSTINIDKNTIKNKTHNLDDHGNNKSTDQNSNQSNTTNDKQNYKPPSNVIKKTMETRNSTKINLSLRSSKNKNLESTTDMYNKDTAKSLNCYTRISHNNTDENIRHSETKKRKIGKTVNIPVPSLT